MRTLTNVKAVHFFILLFLFLIIQTGCKNTGLKQKGDNAYISQVQQWQQKRIENLKRENGWLNLVGLYWLKEGENKFGTSTDNDIVFPANGSYKHIGTFMLKDSTVKIKVNPGIEVLYKGKPVDEMTMDNDLSGHPSILQLNSLKWFVIKRGDRYGIRLRDLDAPLLKEFKGIETYPINDDWRFTAEYLPYTPPRTLTIPTIIGTVEEDKSPGALVFNKDGKEYKLDAIDEGNALFIIFADETNGNETYGAGRFLYTEKPDSTGKVILDFNKAYNPPCAFTKFATCPLPPKQNALYMKVTAGEKMYGHNH